MSPEFAVIFDMDAVMLDTERTGLRAWSAAASSAGVTFDADLYREMIGLGHAGTKSYLRGLSWPDALIERVFADSWTLYEQYLVDEGIRPKDGLFELLDYLEGHNIPKAVATSTETELATQQLARVGILNRLTAIIGGDQVANGKPAPDIFLQAADRLQTAPRNCVVLEDSGPGIRAAAAAGMKIIWVPDLCHVDHPTRQMACGVANTLSEAREILERVWFVPNPRQV